MDGIAPETNMDEYVHSQYQPSQSILPPERQPSSRPNILKLLPANQRYIDTSYPVRIHPNPFDEKPSSGENDY